MQKREEWIMTVQEREQMLNLVEDLKAMSDEPYYKISCNTVNRKASEILAILHGEWIPNK